MSTQHKITTSWTEIVPGVEIRLMDIGSALIEVRDKDDGIFLIRELLGGHTVRIPKEPGEGISQ